MTNKELMLSAYCLPLPVYCFLFSVFYLLLSAFFPTTPYTLHTIRYPLHTYFLLLTSEKCYNYLVRKQRNFKISKAIVWAFSKIILGASTSIFLAGIICLAVFGAWQLLKSLVAPDISRLLTNQSPASSLIVDSQGKLLYEYYSKQKRQIVPLKDISPNLIHATIAVEDKDYFQHKGVWLPGIFRAALFDIHAKDAEHGGSTITQQLVKNVILTKDKSIARKLSEIVWSVEMEKNFSKEEILEKYLNLISYGRNSEGVEAASQSFFGKPAKDLSPLEAAYLASLPKAPSTLSPDGKNRPDLEKRKDYVLELMHEQHFLSDAEFDSNKNLTARFLPYQETLTAPQEYQKLFERLKHEF
jgi:penicillin-binding protein 1A